MIKDFGIVPIDGDKTFSASVSFAEGPSDPPPIDECEVLSPTPELCDGSDDNGSGSGGNAGGNSNSDSPVEVARSGGPSGGVAGGVKGLLPSTGGVSLTVLGAGALLIGGGLLVRRIFR